MDHLSRKCGRHLVAVWLNADTKARVHRPSGIVLCSHVNQGLFLIGGLIKGKGVRKALNLLPASGESFTVSIERPP